MNVCCLIKGEIGYLGNLNSDRKGSHKKKAQSWGIVPTSADPPAPLLNFGQLWLSFYVFDLCWI